MRLRGYRDEDAGYIVRWIREEAVYYQWCAGLFGAFPLTEEKLNWYYRGVQKNIPYWALTAEDERGIVGHITMRFTDRKKKILRLGFVLIDDARRGEGLGKGLVALAMHHGEAVLGAKKITLGVFANNISARYCYEALGFVQEENFSKIYRIKGEDWECIEMSYVPRKA